MKSSLVIAALAILALAFVGCGGSSPKSPAAQDVQTKLAGSRDVYVPMNDVDFDIYNKQLELFDDLGNILWCTFYPPTVGQQPFTKPISPKLMDSGRTPFVTKFVYDQGGTGGGGLRDGEKSDPTGMYGVSVNYLYGFTPTDQYQMFQNFAVECTTEPTVFQQNETLIVVEPSDVLGDISERAKAALAAGDNEGAVEILREAQN